MNKYQVIVGNIGTVYNGDSKLDAESVFADYVKMSMLNYGRAAGELVALLADGEPYEEYEV